MLLNAIVKTVQENKHKYKFYKGDFGSCDNQRCILGLLMSETCGWQTGDETSDCRKEVMQKYEMSSDEWYCFPILNDRGDCDDWDCLIDVVQKANWSKPYWLEFDTALIQEREKNAKIKEDNQSD